MRLGVVVDHLSHVAQSATSLLLLHGFSPALKSLHVKFPILSFPRLGDPTVITQYQVLAENVDGPDRLPTNSGRGHGSQVR